ncbi:NAD(P)/FAD-dependent oxidoreductase [Altibacter sp. HG106]|uniref:NAD(P)/FAD-dependent oxidoreductase n=1 Tax=Altibacter sp. HG106 TaxID=3023937 RepID=UPI002350AE77|nr:FAD-dependent oxidoreductase [Altibacter sp. HG106]MDC7993517.1 FAD-dependent oxidoreductase [Altibacter sp. HG106]
MKSYDIIIIGGGLAGLCCAVHLAQEGVAVCLLEKNTYPHHKVCGEYISNEVVGYLKRLGVDPLKEGAVAIKELHWSTANGKDVCIDLPLGGFGMSRFALDYLLFKKASERAEVRQATVIDVAFQNDTFTVTTQAGDSFEAGFVVGAFGKRSGLDKVLQRSFIEKRTSWMAVKGHYNYEYPEHRVGLHTFEGGYCGLSRTESGSVNACYLATVPSFKKSGSLKHHQQQVVSSNPILYRFFSEATPLFDAPLTISQISFARKPPVEQHIFMVGDSAGLIHPLCGNGMAMAIHGAKIFCELFVHASKTGTIIRQQLEQEYERKWADTFSSRLRTGSYIQQLLLRPFWANAGYQVVRAVPGLLKKVIQQTHGAPLA